MQFLRAGSSFDAAKAACTLQASHGGGIVQLEAGGYDWLGGDPLDLSVYGGGLTLRGENIRATTIRVATAGGPGLIAARPNSSFNLLEHFGIRHVRDVQPPVPAEGEYGVQVIDGAGYGVNLKFIEARFFANAAFHFEGAAGPMVCEDCSAQSCAGYGLKVVRSRGGAQVQNFIWHRGNIQDCYGGSYWDEGIGSAMHDADIELLNPRDPALWLRNGSSGNVFTGNTFSVRWEGGRLPLNTAGGCVVFEGGASGNRLSGGLNYCETSRMPNVYLNGAGVINNEIEVGFYKGGADPADPAARSSYPIIINGATATVITPPRLTWYEPTRRTHLDMQGVANLTKVNGVWR